MVSRVWDVFRMSAEILALRKGLNGQSVDIFKILNVWGYHIG